MFMVYPKAAVKSLIVEFCFAPLCIVRLSATFALLKQSYKYLAESMSMASIDFKKLNRQMMLYRIVQTILTGLLIVLAIIFQGQFAALHKASQFISSIVASIAVQLLVIYPVYRLAWRDAGIEIEGCAPDLSAVQLTALRKKRLIGDLWKFCGVAFFIVFVALVPDSKKAAGAPLVLASTIFSFLLTCLMYFQCFNFSARKLMRG
jgi:hypothetical protein